MWNTENWFNCQYSNNDNATNIKTLNIYILFKWLIGNWLVVTRHKFKIYYSYIFATWYTLNFDISLEITGWEVKSLRRVRLQRWESEN